MGAIIPFAAWKLIQYRMRRKRLPIGFFVKADEKKTHLIIEQQKQKIIQQLRFLPYVTSFLLGGIMIVMMLRYNLSEQIMLLLFLSVLLFISLTDLWFFLVPNEVIWFGTVLFMAMRVWLSPHHFKSDFIAMITVLILGWLLCHLTGGMGLGDVKFLAMAVWVIGGIGVLLSFWFASALALVTVGYKRCMGQKKVFNKPIPFIPYLALGMVISLSFGEGIWNWYLSMFWLVK